jgi:hypothetical protein
MATFCLGRVQITQVFAPWLTQTVRVYANKLYAELEWIVGSIPIDDACVSATVRSCCRTPCE